MKKSDFKKGRPTLSPRAEAAHAISAFSKFTRAS